MLLAACLFQSNRGGTITNDKSLSDKSSSGVCSKQASHASQATVPIFTALLAKIGAHGTCETLGPIHKGPNRLATLLCT